jgi:hypothetical protein
MTSELAEYGDGAYIEEFVSAGPKHYAYRVRKPDGGTVERIKIRGFTLSHSTAGRLNLESLRRKVFDFVEGLQTCTTVEQPRIVRIADGRRVATREGVKKHRVVYTKRWVLPDFSTKPFGTCDPE